MKRAVFLFGALFLFAYVVYAGRVDAPVPDIPAPQKAMRVLIVIGHDDVVWGGKFGVLKEVELNRMLGRYLYDLLAQDPLFEPTITQHDGAYIPELAEFLNTQKDRIVQYRAELKKTFVETEEPADVDDIKHNKVSEDVANILYGTNLWAQEKDFDVLLHIHFNDYPGRPRTSAGKYAGFAIYVPDHTLQNGPESIALGKVLHETLGVFQPESNLFIEQAGVIESEDLIALGARNSLDIPSVLIEYAYIAEPRLNDERREGELQAMAQQTYEGLKKFYTE